MNTYQHLLAAVLIFAGFATLAFGGAEFRPITFVLVGVGLAVWITPAHFFRPLTKNSTARAIAHDVEATSIPRPFGRLPRGIREQLQYARSIGKRLDEHREVVEAIASKTNLFELSPWHANHMATQDDFLMRLYYMVYDSWPEDAPALNGGKWRQATGERVRPRPAILRPCALPERREAGRT